MRVLSSLKRFARFCFVFFRFFFLFVFQFPIQKMRKQKRIEYFILWQEILISMEPFGMDTISRYVKNQWNINTHHHESCNNGANTLHSILKIFFFCLNFHFRWFIRSRLFVHSKWIVILNMLIWSLAECTIKITEFKNNHRQQHFRIIVKIASKLVNII